ncbi:thioredoxin family protein [Candidatus Woesearchaeota archaeon]|nr:thioredoxin family protein [Candidatus Woesearchaeota archaeon]
MKENELQEALDRKIAQYYRNDKLISLAIIAFGVASAGTVAYYGQEVYFKTFPDSPSSAPTLTDPNPNVAQLIHSSAPYSATTLISTPPILREVNSQPKRTSKPAAKEKSHYQPKPQILYYSTPNVTGSKLEGLIGQPKPTVVDFYASWCGPCKLLEPVFNQVATQYKEQATFVRINIDTENAAAIKYGATKIPLVIVFQNGTEDSRFNGYSPNGTMNQIWMKDTLDRLLAK